MSHFISCFQPPEHEDGHYVDQAFQTWELSYHRTNISIVVKPHTFTMPQYDTITTSRVKIV